MGRLPLLLILCAFLFAFDYYCFKAILNVFKNWKPTTKKWFAAFWWGYNYFLIFGVFISIFVTIPIFYLSLRSIILVAFFLTTACKLVMLPFLLADDLR